MNAIPGNQPSSILDRRALLVSAVATGIGISTAISRIPRATAASQAGGPFDVTTTAVDWSSDTATSLARPHCLAISPAGRLHVVDGDRNVVAVFDNGAFVREWGDPAIAGPVTGIAIDTRAFIYLADGGSRAIRAYDAAGRPRAVITECADGTTFAGLAALMFGGDGALYVVDAGGGRVLKLRVPPLGTSPDDTYLPHEPQPVP